MLKERYAAKPNLLEENWIMNQPYLAEVDYEELESDGWVSSSDGCFIP